MYKTLLRSRIILIRFRLQEGKNHATGSCSIKEDEAAPMPQNTGMNYVKHLQEIVSRDFGVPFLIHWIEMKFVIELDQVFLPLNCRFHI
jgi:hypothetical protein